MKFDQNWRYDSPGGLSRALVDEIETLIGKIAAQGASKGILEHFKRYFASSYGVTAGPSSDVRWAQSDLHATMVHASKNAPLFIDAFFEGCEALRFHDYVDLPDVARVNRILAAHGAGFEVRLPNIVAVGEHRPIPLPERMMSLDQSAREAISVSFRESERLLAEGRPREAVQEILWLLESVVTAFRGMSAEGSTIIEKYFNKIATELQQREKGTTLEQVLEWLATLHDYLSSPTGGVRPGADQKAGTTVDPAEGFLYCNLIRSYVTFLMAEYERQSGPLNG